MSGQRRSTARSPILLLIVTLLLSACAVPAEATRASVSAIPTAEPTARVLKLTVSSSGSQSQVTVKRVETTPTPLPSPTATPTLPLSPTAPILTEPVIFSGLGFDRPCGHADIVAYDGHALRATPRLLLNNSNFYEELDDGTRVELIDCRLWTDLGDLTWVAVQTETGKLGWILIQPDSVYVTIYPIVQTPPPALTGMPAGSMVAYVPPSECQEGPVTNEGVATSIGIDLIPVVGDIKGLGEAATGCDLVTGEPLGDWRWFGLLGIIGMSEVALLRHGDEVADVARIGGNLDSVARNADELAAPLARNANELAAPMARNADEVAGVAGRNADEAGSVIGRNADAAGDLTKAAGKVDGVLDEGIDAAKLMENGSSSVEEAALLAAKFEQPCSFSAVTPVRTDRGLVPISQVDPGDMVLAYHEESGITGYYTVTNAFAHLDPVIVSLEIGGEQIETTPEHPFYVDGGWVAAGELEVGDALLSSGGMSAEVDTISAELRRQIMYSLTVADAHTYYVGGESWLVHNACARVLRRNLDGHLDSWTRDAEWQAHHIVPGKFEDHPFVQRARNAGWDIDGASNGVALPLRPAIDSSGKQVQLPLSKQLNGNFDGNIGKQLDLLEESAIKNQWTDVRAKNKIERVVRSQRQSILALPVPRFQPKRAFISERRRTHILYGDATGGGHLWPGAGNKSSFPQNWDAPKVLDNVEDIGTSPSTRWYAKPGQEGFYTSKGNPSRWDAWETRDAVRIHVVYEPATGNIITAYPDSRAATGTRVNLP